MLPKPIYEILPAVYSAGGVLAIMELESNIGRLAGCLLLSAAVAIITLRRVYRSEG